MLVRLLVLVLVLHSVLSVRLCRLDSQNLPTCNHTLFNGRCVRPYIASSEHWCRWEQKDMNVCCAQHDHQCCTTSTEAGEFALTVILIVLIACCCCCVALSRSTVRRDESSQQHPTIGQRFLLRVSPRYRERYAREEASRRALQGAIATPHQLNRDGTSLEQVMRPVFVFPDLPPLNIEKPKECIICFESDRDTVLPCGHSVMCKECCQSLLQHNKPCPHCRKPFSNFAVAPLQPTFRGFEKPATTPRLRPETTTTTTTTTTQAPLRVELVRMATFDPYNIVIDSNSSSDDNNDNNDNDSNSEDNTQPTAVEPIPLQRPTTTTTTTTATTQPRATQGSQAVSREESRSLSGSESASDTQSSLTS